MDHLSDLEGVCVAITVNAFCNMELVCDHSSVVPLAPVRHWKNYNSSFEGLELYENAERSIVMFYEYTQLEYNNLRCYSLDVRMVGLWWRFAVS